MIFQGKTYIEYFLYSLILFLSDSETEGHLYGQRGGITTQMVDDKIWSFKEANKHRLCLNILVGYVRPRSLLIQNAMAKSSHLL